MLQFRSLALGLLGASLLFGDVAWAQTGENAAAAPAPAAGGASEVRPPGEWGGTDANGGINLMSARRTRDGFLVRVRRRIKPGSDTAKEFARNIPLVSTAANWATLGLFRRVLRSDGEAVRATWLAMNCTNKTFNVAGDGYSWQNIYKDQLGQAEDLYFMLCESNQKDAEPRYLSLPPADPDMLRASQMGL